MAVSSLVRYCPFWYCWTGQRLPIGYQRKALSSCICGTRKYQLQKKTTDASKKNQCVPSILWGISHLAKRGLHATLLYLQEVMLTSERYGVQRLPFAHVSNSDVSFFEHLMPGRVITELDELKPYNVDWLKSVRGKVFYHLLKPLLLPSTSLIIAYHRLPLKKKDFIVYTCSQHLYTCT